MEVGKERYGDLDAAAYLVAESARPAGVWPAGKLQLFRDGAFVGKPGIGRLLRREPQCN